MFNNKTLTSAVAIACLCTGSVMAGGWTVTQESDLTGVSLIEQGSTGSVNNSTQAVNSLATDNSDMIYNSQQTVTATTAVLLEQSGGGTTGSIQALNKMSSPEITGDSTKQIAEVPTLGMHQDAGGGSNVQAANLMQGAAITVGDAHVAQHVDSNLVMMTQTSDTSLQAGNAVISNAASVNNSFKQQFDVSSGLGMFQNNTTGSGQYGNYGGSNTPSN